MQFYSERQKCINACVTGNISELDNTVTFWIDINQIILTRPQASFLLTQFKCFGVDSFFIFPFEFTFWVVTALGLFRKHRFLIQSLLLGMKSNIVWRLWQRSVCSLFLLYSFLMTQFTLHILLCLATYKCRKPILLSLNFIVFVDFLKRTHKPSIQYISKKLHEKWLTCCNNDGIN